MIGGFYLGQLYYGGASTGGAVQLGANIQGAATLQVSTVIVYPISSSLSGDAQLASTLSVIVPISSSLAGDANFSAVLALGKSLVASLAGDAGFTSSFVQIGYLSSALAGDATIDVLFEKRIRANLSADGTLSLSRFSLPVSLTVSGDATVNASLLRKALLNAALAGDSQAALILYPYFGLKGDSSFLVTDMRNYMGIRPFAGTGDLYVALVRGEFLTSPLFDTGQYARGRKALDGTLVVSEEPDAGQYARGRKEKGAYQVASTGDTGSWTEP